MFCKSELLIGFSCHLKIGLLNILPILFDFFFSLRPWNCLINFLHEWI